MVNSSGSTRHSLNALPDDWQAWHSKICQLLEVRTDIKGLPKQWFLIPTQGELDETDAKRLLASVGNHLVGDYGKPVSEVRGRLLGLTPDASLIFLYAMRYIAFRDASAHHYWPKLRHALFEDRLSYEDVALGLANTCSTLWIKLYEYTNGALFYPREGSRHIKWPLAHAGLLGDDKLVLRDFGLSIITSSSELYSTTISLEVDEFVLFFRDWLRSNYNHSYSRLAELMDGKSERKATIAELCQQWLIIHRSELETSTNTPNVFSRTTLPTRRNLVYDAHNNRLGITVSVGRLQGNHNAVLHWNSHSYPLRSQYVQSSGQSIPLELFLPLDAPSWPGKSELHVGDISQYEFTLPTLEANKGVVFEISTGQQTKRWELGEEYYVLIPGKKLKADRASILFADWMSLGSPEGNWEDYNLLWVRTRDPFSEAKSSIEVNVTELIEALEDASDKLGLPSFGHQYRIRASLICEQFADMRSSRTPAFSISHPPLVELRGVWSDPVKIDLAKHSPITGKFDSIDNTLVPKGLSGQPRIIRLWDQEPEAGLYRLRVNDIELNFAIKNALSEEIQENVASLHLTAHFIDSSANHVQRVSRHGLSEVELFVQAWPQADLTLEITAYDSSYAYIVPIQTDNTGLWQGPVSHLPIVFDDLPNGHIKLRINWRSLFGYDLVAQDTGFLSSEHIKLIAKHDNGDYWVDCRGFIQGDLSRHEIYGLVFANPPWMHTPEIFYIDVDTNGSFSEEISVAWKPAWVLIGSQLENLSEELMPIAINEVDLQRNDNVEIVRIQNAITKRASTWNRLAPKISEVSHPFSLNVHIEIASVLRLLREIAVLSRPALYRWQFFKAWSDLDQIRAYQDCGCQIALFRDIPNGRQAQWCGGVQINFDNRTGDRIPFKFDESVPEESGELIRVRADFWRFSFVSHTELRGCSKCKLIIPSNSFEHHQRPYLDLEDCTSFRKEYKTYKVGQEANQYVVIGVLINEEVGYTNLIEQLSSVLQGSRDFSPEVETRLRALRAFVPQGVDQRRWLERFIATLQAIWRLRSHTDLTVGQLGQIGNSITGYEEALKWTLKILQADMIEVSNENS